MGRFSAALTESHRGIPPWSVSEPVIWEVLKSCIGSGPGTAAGSVPLPRAAIPRLGMGQGHTRPFLPALAPCPALPAQGHSECWDWIRRLKCFCHSLPSLATVAPLLAAPLSPLFFLPPSTSVPSICLLGLLLSPLGCPTCFPRVCFLSSSFCLQCLFLGWLEFSLLWFLLQEMSLGGTSLLGWLWAS